MAALAAHQYYNSYYFQDGYSVSPELELYARLHRLAPSIAGLPNQPDISDVYRELLVRFGLGIEGDIETAETWLATAKGVEATGEYASYALLGTGAIVSVAKKKLGRFVGSVAARMVGGYVANEALLDMGFSPEAAEKIMLGASALTGYMRWKYTQRSRTPGYVASPKYQKPHPKNGEFLGAEGNSDFKLSDNAADAMGLPRGTKIPWRDGIPDFFDHAVPGPGGIPKAFDVPGLFGGRESKGDDWIIKKYLSKQTGLSMNAITKWLSANKVSPHHSGGISVQLVPRRIHRLHHSGGAEELRNLAQGNQ